MKIAIVGMGVSGISVLREWTREQEKDPSIKLTVFGDKDTFGTGLPYQKDFEGLLMNQAAKLTKIIPEKEDDFINWMKENHEEENPEFKYYPRAQFGAYLTERMNGWLNQSKAEIVQEKVEKIQLLPNNRFQLSWSSSVEEFDAVHLCIGHLPYKDPFDLMGHPRVIDNPFPMEKKLSQIPHGATIGVLGTGLTSIDVFRYTYAKRPDLKVAFSSHSGRFKTTIGTSKPVENQIFTEENVKQAIEKNNGFIPLETYLEWFKEEIKNQQLSTKNKLKDDELGSQDSIESELEDSSELGIIQSVLDNMDMFLTDIWMALTETDKQRFLDTYYKQWDKLRSPFPPATGEDLVSAWEENTINVYDNLIDIVKNEQSFTFVLKDQEDRHMDYVINTAGNVKNVSLEMGRMPLLRQLLDERLVQPEAFGGVQVSLPDLSAISQRYGVLHTLKIHGQLISGIQFGNNSVNIISNTAKLAVQDIVEQLEKR